MAMIPPRAQTFLRQCTAPARRSLIIAILAACLPCTVHAFDSGHHWEVTSQVLQEMGFSDDARQTACVSNWMLDYYSSSPTVSKKVREELSKLHCDNLYTAAAGQRYLLQFTQNSKSALVSQANNEDISDREIMLLLGAALHVVQDLYAHSNWPEKLTSEKTLSSRTWFSSGQRVPAGFLTGAYESPSYFGNTMPPGHPMHGTYRDGLNKDCHDQAYWPQAYYLSYCATREFVEAFRTWVSPARWNRLRMLDLSLIEKAELTAEIEAAYGISLWIDMHGAHGHWKGGGSGHNRMFFKSILSFVSVSSRNARWYRQKKGYRPLLEGLYPPEPIGTAPLARVPGLNLKRTAIMLRVRQVRETGDTLDGIIAGKPDFYLTCGAHYGKTRIPEESLSMLTNWRPISEPFSPLKNLAPLNGVFRDRVIQNKVAAENPWQTLLIADNQLLDQHRQTLTFFLNVRDEDPIHDEIADLSPAPHQRTLYVYYDLRRNQLTLPETGQTFACGQGKPITLQGDHRHRVALTFEIYQLPTK